MGKRVNVSKMSKLPPAKVTIVEVAEKAGVSLGTVSRVLNNDIHVSPQTRERVSTVVRDMGYVANRQARSLKGSRTNIIGMLVPDLGTGYIGEIMRGVDTELGLNQLDMMLFTTHRAAVKEANYVANMAQGMVDGLLLVLPRNPADFIGTLTNRNFPFVLIDHQGTSSPCPAVGATNWQGAYNATEYLIKLGHIRIGFISGSMDLGAAVDRLDGYTSAIRAHHVTEDPRLIYHGTFFQPEGFAGASALMDLQDPPTAIFASNDVMAMGAMDAVRNRGLRVPEDVSILGFDDIPQAEVVRPALTTVRQPLRDMGAFAAQMLIDRLKNPEKQMTRIELPTELIVRASTSSPKNKAG
jgi:LacI family transcriptional regulator